MELIGKFFEPNSKIRKPLRRTYSIYFGEERVKSSRVSQRQKSFGDEMHDFVESFPYPGFSVSILTKISIFDQNSFSIKTLMFCHKFLIFA